MDRPVSCASCGTALGPGRFCTNCGSPVAGDGSDTNPRLPRVTAAPLAPSEPEPHPESRAESRAEPVDPTVTQVRRAVPPSPPPAADPSADVLSRAETPRQHRRPPRIPGVVWAVMAAVALLTAVVVGGLRLLGTSGDEPGVTPFSHLHSESPTHDGKSRHPRHSSSAAPSSSPTTRNSPTKKASPSASPGAVSEVATGASVSAPAVAPAGVDFDGRPVTFVAANIVDGRVDTCWREPGDGTGTQLVIRLARPTVITSLGIVNGYAKTAHARGRAYDWYDGNRRLLGVTWSFDDGSAIGQALTESRAMQRVRVPHVTTRTIRLRINGVTPPGSGIASRDDTAISEVSILGRPAR